MRARQIEGSEARMTAAYVRSVGERDRAAGRQQATAAAADGRRPAAATKQQPQPTQPSLARCAD